MAQYDMSTYSLRFTDDFKKIQVCTSAGCDSPTAEYALDAASTSVQVVVDGDDYVITNETAITAPSYKIDVGAGGCELVFEAARLDSVGIVDLRDMRVSGSTETSFSIDLECSPLRLQYVPGPFALRLHLTDPDCLVYPQ